MYSNNNKKSLFGKIVDKVTGKSNREHPKELKGKCEKADLNNIFDKYGKRGFNNQL